jgi:hypothetical protein
MMDKIRDIIYDIFAVLGIFFLIVIVHELVHFIDGYGPNIAICFGFINWKRLAFVINGDNYTLFRGELLAYSVSLIMAIGIFFLLFYKKK